MEYVLHTTTVSLMPLRSQIGMISRYADRYATSNVVLLNAEKCCLELGGYQVMMHLIISSDVFNAIAEQVPKPSLLLKLDDFKEHLDNVHRILKINAVLCSE